MLNKQQVLSDLQNVLGHATENGLLDDLAAWVHPNVINDFCCAVDDLEKSEHGQPELNESTKSEILNEMARELGLPILEIKLAEACPGDFIGFPIRK